MTALKKYTRLEASGLWKESKKAGFIEILISIGKTSVILSDYNDNPLTHWSLAAIKLVSQNPNEAMFSTDLDNGEILLIKDSHMIEALLLFINRDPQKPRNNKVFIKTCVSLLVILLTTFILYFPSKIKELVASVISKQHERQIIAPFLHTHIESSGGICTSKKTDEISRKIVNLVDKTNSFISFSIIRNQKLNVLHLPSGEILISRRFLENSNSGERLLQLLENELRRAIDRKPLDTLINQQTYYQLIKFVLGFELELSIEEINDFLRPSPKFTNAQTDRLDDFSWVALQNACLN
tara:strand:+ start:264 stop:1151 length:888 start_codon:yes stop_codon:yes gene_type:complete